MKKLLCFGVALTFLSACTNYDPNLDRAAEKRAENRAEVRDHIGCQFPDDHDAYRRCLIATYEHSKPKTYTTTQDHTGRPVAVISGGATVQPQGYVAAVTPQGALVPAGQAVVAPAVNQGVLLVPAGQPTVPTRCAKESTEPCLYQTKDMYEVQVPALPCPSENCGPVVVEKKEIIEEKPIEVVPMPKPLPDKTWWETYQEEKQPEEPKIVCPCPDPNDPCPQCVTK